MAKGCSVAVFGAKGGIGKTIFTLNLAGAMSKQNKTCLIIDADFYSGQIDCALNKKASKDIYNFADDYGNNRYKDFEDYVTVYNKNISFIAAPTDPRRANRIDPKYLKIVLDKAIFKYDFVIFDMSHILNEVNVNILDMVDKILMMTTNDPLDLKNLKTVLNLFKDSSIDKYKVILNDSVANNRDYFSLYDLKVIIDNNVDYIISNKFYVPNMDAYVFDGKIYTLEAKKYADEDIFNLIIKDMGGTDE